MSGHFTTLWSKRIILSWRRSVLFRANQWTGFYMTEISVMKELKLFSIEVTLFTERFMRYKKLSEKRCRSSRVQMFFKLGVLADFAIFTGKHLCWSLFLIKLQGLRPATLLKRDCSKGVFLWILAKFLRTTFFIEHLRWLLLVIFDWKIARKVFTWKRI